MSFQELKYYLTQKSIDEDRWLEPPLAYAHGSTNEEALWELSPHFDDLSCPDISEGNHGEILPGYSFLRFLGIEPDFSPLLKRIAAPSCPNCSGHGLHKNQEKILEEIKSLTRGTILLGISFNEANLGGLTLESILSLYGVRSIAVKGIRLVGETLDPYLHREVAEIPDLILILDSIATPISSFDLEKISRLKQQYNNVNGKLHYGILLNADSAIIFNSFESQFLCPNGHGPIQVSLENGLFIGARSLLEIHQETVASTLLMLADKLGDVSFPVRILKAVSATGFAGYRLDEDIRKFSKGEILRLHLAQFLLGSGADWTFNCSKASSFLDPAELKAIKANIASKFEVSFPKIKWGIDTSSALKSECRSIKGDVVLGPYTDKILKEVLAPLPRSGIVAVIGWSGSGKSTLLQSIGSDKNARKYFKSVRQFSYPANLDLNATLFEVLGLSVPIGKLFSDTLEARTLGITAREVVAESERSSTIRFNGHSYYDVLSLTISAAHQVFTGIRQIEKTLNLAICMGFGPNILNENISSLSSGNQQGLYLTEFLSALDRGPGLLLLDAPLSGMEPELQQNYIKVIQEIAASGFTVVAAENSAQFRNISDSVIELSVEISENGSRISRIS